MSPSPPFQEPAADLLEQLLGSLLADFRAWFCRGRLLLDLCPDRVMAVEQRDRLRRGLEEGLLQLEAARTLRQALPVPMVLGMDCLAPWHQLVLRVWSLSASLRNGGVEVPPMEWPDLSAMASLLPLGLLPPEAQLGGAQLDGAHWEDGQAGGDA